MIRLVATDMDGTLLDSRAQLPPDFFHILDLLSARNIFFVAASGRTYLTVYNNFTSYADKINYICDNGSCIILNGSCIYETFLEIKKLHELIHFCSTVPGLILSLCGKKSSYHTITKENANHEVIKYHSHYLHVPDLTTVTDQIYKVAIYDEFGPSSHIYPILEETFQNDFTLQVSGKYWMDVMPPNTNKGTALKIIQKRLDILPSETMAFGDYYNDVEMLNNAHYSFVMKNAAPDMFQYGRYIAESNDNFGVIQAINQYIFSK